MSKTENFVKTPSNRRHFTPVASIERAPDRVDRRAIHPRDPISSASKMSHSSTLITPRVSHRVSFSASDNMALASDTLFDKFGLFENAGGNSVVTGGDVVSVASNLANVADPNTQWPNFGSFEDLDFADLLEIKEEEPSSTLESAVTTDSLMGADPNGMDPFFMESSTSSLLDDASLDSIKSDCMWSSVNLWNNVMDTNNSNINLNSTAVSAISNSNSRKRRRDVSLTLSECAEGLLAINHLDVNMLDSDLADVKPNVMGGNNPTLGSSPPFLSSSFGNLDHDDDDEDDLDDDDQSLTSEEASEESENEDEIIDVVSTDLVGSSARTRHTFSSRKTQNHNHSIAGNKVEAGRSLLKKQFHRDQQKSENSSSKLGVNSENNRYFNDNYKQTSILADHCYFLTTRPNSMMQNDASSLDSHHQNNMSSSQKSPNTQIKGMLTPNESSEDEEENSSLFATGTPTIMTTTSQNLVDKRKIGKLIFDQPSATATIIYLNRDNVGLKFFKELRGVFLYLFFRENMSDLNLFRQNKSRSTFFMCKHQVIIFMIGPAHILCCCAPIQK